MSFLFYGETVCLKGFRYNNTAFTRRFTVVLPLISWLITLCTYRSYPF